MIIALEDLAAKRVKSTPEVGISDHTITLTNAPKDHELIFTGKGTRGLVFKDAKGKIIFRQATIDNASTGVTLKFDGTYDGIKVDGEGTSKLFGKAGNAASQMIYFQGTWSNVEVCGFDIDHRRNANPGSTTTGACVQFAGVFVLTHNLGDVNIHDIIIRNAGDEGVYVNHYTKSTGAASGENLTVDRVQVFGCGRDPFQSTNFRKISFRNCHAEKAALETEPNHISMFSLNGGHQEILIDTCRGKNIPQFVYSGTEGTTVKAVIQNCDYEQGKNTVVANQAFYLKGPGEYTIKNCIINAPAVKEAAISADGCKVIVDSTNKITAPKLSRTFNGGSVVQGNPDPVTVTTHGDLIIETTTTWDGMVSVKYFALIANVKTELIVK